MPRTEQDYLDLCKKEIEQKFSLGNGQAVAQRDLELLAAHIEEKTGVVISLSTLKRLWKDSHKQSPQLATLDALAQVLDYNDWKDFKYVNQKKPAAGSFPGRSIAIGAVVVTIVSGLILVFLFNHDGASAQRKPRGPVVSGVVKFEASKTVSIGVPSTTIFKYDLSMVEADSFSLQQSWNPDHRVPIDPKGNAITSIYFESGYHRATLVADDSVLATLPVHILSNGWEPHIYHHESEPELIDFGKEKFISQGILHIDRSILEKRGIDFNKRFNTRITNSQAFNVNSDNFSFTTRMKADSVFDRVCGWMDMVIVTEADAFTVSWTAKGCEKYAAYELGEIHRKGTDTDLSALGTDLFEWQELEVRVKDKNAEIHLNGKLVYTEKYQQDFGNIVSLIYLFDGTGSIDYARLRDGDGKIVFAEEFGLN